LVPVLGLAGGFLVVRNPPKREYALSTLGNTMQASSLAESGICSAPTAIGGRIWQDT
jgi:hypothetical protein